MCCSSCHDNTLYGSEELLKLIPPYCNFGYDVMVYVGKALFFYSRSEQEIVDNLSRRCIPISRSEVSYLAKKFIVYLSITHRESKSAIKGKMRQHGGYILHLDATSEGDSPHLLSVLDGISEIVLDNIKLPSENAENLVPFLQRVKQMYGNPLATVHDMGKGIITAVQSVFKGVRDFICHFHFLRDIGKDLFGKENDAIRKCLRKHAIQGYLRKQARSLKKHAESDLQLIAIFEKSMHKDDTINAGTTPGVIAYLLVNWVLEGKRVGNGYGFPFDRAYLSFYQRLCCAYKAVDKLRYTMAQASGKHQRVMGKLWRKIGETVNDPILKRETKRIEEKARVFDRLREAMRIALPHGKNALNDDGDYDMKSIAHNVRKFHGWLHDSGCIRQDDAYRKMNDQIEKYWKKLFADPIIRKTKHGRITIYPQRTNNILERFFRDFRKMYRKRNGNNSLNKTLKAMLADTPLVKNLENPQYLKIILAGANSLEERFAQIDSKLVRENLKRAEEENRKMHPKIRKIIMGNKFPEKLVKVVSACQLSN